MKKKTYCAPKVKVAAMMTEKMIAYSNAEATDGKSSPKDVTLSDPKQSSSLNDSNPPGAKCYSSWDDDDNDW